MRIGKHAYNIIVFVSVLATSSCSVMPLTSGVMEGTTAENTSSGSKAVNNSVDGEQSDETVEQVIFLNGKTAQVVDNTILNSDGAISTIVGGAGSHVIILNSDGSLSVGVNNGGITTVVTP